MAAALVAFASSAIIGAESASAADGPTLTAVKKRGELICGVHQGRFALARRRGVFDAGGVYARLRHRISNSRHVVLHAAARGRGDHTLVPGLARRCACRSVRHDRIIVLVFRNDASERSVRAGTRPD